MEIMNTLVMNTLATVLYFAGIAWSFSHLESSQSTLSPDSDILNEAIRAYDELDLGRAYNYAVECASESAECLGLLAELTFIADRDTGLMKLREQADSGNADSQYLLGVILSNVLDHGNNVSTFSLGTLYLYAASTAGHEGALALMGYRHWSGLGTPERCETAALNYVEVAKRVAEVYSSGLPRALELVRLSPPSLTGGKEAIPPKVSQGEMALYRKLALADPHVALNLAKRYLLGIDGFPQDYPKALGYLRMHKEFPGSLALEGYMRVLGLGVEKDLTKAKVLFELSTNSSSRPNDTAIDSPEKQADPYALNGLGYLSFLEGDYTKAFARFNESAHKGSADGLFNAGSLYLSGLGVGQHFQRAAVFFTQALELGHTPAAYALALMHLNGVGTGRDCRLGVKLLKEVAERASWLARGLQRSYKAGSSSEGVTGYFSNFLQMFAQRAHGSKDFILKAAFGSPSEFPTPLSSSEIHSLLYSTTSQTVASALAYLKSAEAGHELSQQNLAHLLEGEPWLISRLFGFDDKVANPRSLMNWFLPSPPVPSAHAQRFYELSADQGGSGSAAAEVRLGDYAYNGWGLRVRMDSKGGVGYLNGSPDSEAAIAHYRKVASMSEDKVSSGLVGVARFNLGWMMEWSEGEEARFSLAAEWYRKAFGKGFLGGAFASWLRLHAWLHHWSTVSNIQNDPRVKLALSLICVIPGLVFIRRRLTRVFNA